MGDKRIYIAGIGPGNIDLVTPAAMKAIEDCDVLIGGRRNLELFDYLMKEKVVITSDLEPVCTYILGNAGRKKITVLATGDPGIFSISEFLKRRLPDVKLEIIPGISSFQYLCSRIGISWHDMVILSLHGRDNDKLFAAVKANRKTAIFTGGDTSPVDVCKYLIQNGIRDITITVGERLSYPDERIITGTVDEISKMEFDSLALMLVQWKSDKEPRESWEYETPGIPDHMFVRDDVPMTKEEIRTIAISKLRLKKDSIVFDIGAGTGSVSVECGLICCKGKVYAVEREKKAVGLIHRNLDKFKLDNVIVVEGSAPEVLDDIPVPDRVFIGGTGGHMEAILDWITRSSKETRVVVNAISPESAYEALKGFEKRGFRDIELVNITVSKGLKTGDRHIMRALNPIYIISGQKGGIS